MDAEHHNKVISKAIMYIQNHKSHNNSVDVALIEELKAIKTKYRKETFLAMDTINDEHEDFNNIKDARSYLTESILDSSFDNWHPDIKTCKIYTLSEVATINELDELEFLKI